MKKILKIIQFPFWFICMYPLMFVSYILSDYAMGWTWNHLWKACLNYYWSN